MTDFPKLPLGKYRHYKGNFYQVLSLARHSETQEWFVVYRPLYGDQSPANVWVRPLSMFGETVVVDGLAVPRFAYVSED